MFSVILTVLMTSNVYASFLIGINVCLEKYLMFSMILAVVIVRIIFSRFLVALICTVTEVVVVVKNFPFQSMARSHNCQDFKHCEEVYGWPKPELAK